MDKSFSSVEFLKGLAEELVDSFSRAGRATTPGLVGTAREHAVRQKLEAILPPVAGVGSGCVIDSLGSTSKQQDVVLFEKHLCPVFSINQTPDTTYYPCEGVIAVGEVKSALDRKGLEDAFAKIRSVKQLERFNPDPMSWRKYGSGLVAAGAPSEQYEPSTKVSDQIYAFVLCDHLELQVQTFLLAYRELCLAEKSELCPNILVSLRDGCAVFLSPNAEQVRLDRNSAAGVGLSIVPNGNFQYLLTHLNWIIIYGRTVEALPFQRYILGGDGRIQTVNYIPFDSGV